jgi:hypothetical protein
MVVWIKSFYLQQEYLPWYVSIFQLCYPAVFVYCSTLCFYCTWLFFFYFCHFSNAILSVWIAQILPLEFIYLELHLGVSGSLCWSNWSPTCIQKTTIYTIQVSSCNSFSFSFISVTVTAYKLLHLQAWLFFPLWRCASSNSLGNWCIYCYLYITFA